jgi:hypothetical protein
VTSAVHLQDYAGSMLRGAFGHAFRQLSCMTKARDCQGCDMVAVCPFAQVFSPYEIPREHSAFQTLQQLPVNFVIEPPQRGARHYAEGELLIFDMVLMGSALSYLSIIIMAWRRTFLKGLGREEGKGELLDVFLINEEGQQVSIYTEDNPVIAAHRQVLTLSDTVEAETIRMKLQTPLRIEIRKQPLGARAMTEADFFNSLIRRISLLAPSVGARDIPKTELHHIVRQLRQQAESVSGEKRLSWKEWTRYSGRQNQAIKLGGVIGDWHLYNVTPALQQILLIGTWLHAGKETVFGLGKYQIEPTINDKHRLLVASNQHSSTLKEATDFV